jgi:F0F1-type ATP synthase membrane subunit b/b'
VLITSTENETYRNQSPQGEDEALEAALRELKLSISHAEQELDQALADVRADLNDRFA